MARPNSKYFTPVIKKILAVKKSENIVVDQDFKNLLRSQIIAKIQAAPVKHEVLPERQKFDFSEFFNRFRYPLAIVPSMLLLVVVAMNAMKLPVSIPNEVVVPVVNSVKNEGENTTQLPEQTEPSKLRTFSGADVLPKNLKSGDASPRVIDNSQAHKIVFNPSDPSDAVPSVGNVSKNNVQQVANNSSSPVDQGVNPFEMMLKSLVQQPEFDGNSSFESQRASNVSNDTQGQTNTSSDQGENVSSLPPVQAVNSDVSTANVQLVQPDVIKDPALLMNAVQPDVTQPVVLEPQAVNNASKVQLTQPQVVPDVNTTLDASQSLNAVQSNVSIDSAIDTTFNQQSVQSFSLSANQLYEKHSYEFYYTADVADSEKAAFEQVAVEALGDVSFVSANVLPGTEDDVVEVVYLLADGSTVQKVFKKTDSGWALAQYVQRYYYQGPLQYNVLD